MKARVNLLCIAGATIGIVSLFAVWTSIWITTPEDGPSLVDVKTGFDFLGNATSVHRPTFGWGDWVEEKCLAAQVAIVVFAAGTAIAFLSPIGGFVQLAGVLRFVQVTEYGETPFPFAHASLERRIGIPLALLSTIVVLWSVAFPQVLGPATRPIGIVQRLLTFSRLKESAMEMDKESVGRKPFHRIYVPPFAVFLAALVVAPPFLVIHDYYSQPCSRLEVTFYNELNQSADFTFLIDGEPKAGCYIYPGDQDHGLFWVSAGTHSLELDFYRPDILTIYLTSKVGPLEAKVVDIRIQP